MLNVPCMLWPEDTPFHLHVALIVDDLCPLAVHLSTFLTGKVAHFFSKGTGSELSPWGSCGSDEGKTDGKIKT